MHALMTAIVTWLSVNFGLPADYHLPIVRLVPPAEVAHLRSPFLVSAEREGPSPVHGPDPPASVGDVLAVYEDRTGTILLQENWAGITPGELSVLVHELVHHLQHRAGSTFACPQERERMAYAAQEKWLGLFGTSLRTEFDIDAMTLLVRTTCAY